MYYREERYYIIPKPEKVKHHHHHHRPKKEEPGWVHVIGGFIMLIICAGFVESCSRTMRPPPAASR